MLTRSILSFRSPTHPFPWTLRWIATAPNVKPTPQSHPPPKRPPQTTPTDHIPEEVHSPNWLTQAVRSSSVARSVFLGVASLLGYGNPRQFAARRAFGLYEKACTVRADEDSEFWRESCHLPPTFQSWFTITNLHIWLLTVRLRALPPPHGDAYIQGLIDHFFIDVEDRIRAVLQPSSSSPYTSPSTFYTTPSAKTKDNKTTTEGEEGNNDNNNNTPPRRRGRAPDRLVTRQMHIFKEQWTGMGMAFDLGLVMGDMDMAAAVWRNLLGARGARGIAYPAAAAAASTPSASPFRRSVNLVGGLVDNPADVDRRGLDAEEARDDMSGVHDFPPAQVDKYLTYPEVMVDVVTYIRRELQRLERIPDEQIIRGDIMAMKFGPVRPR